MTDLMIDLETLGTKPDAPIISLGAVFFDPFKGTVGPNFYMVLDVKEQIKYGRKPDGDTLKWWMGQSGAAKKVFSDSAKPVAEILQLFTKWIKANEQKKGRQGVYVWGNGSTFDISLMENIYIQYGLDAPWNYNSIMDLRTFKRFVGNGQQIKKSGTNHNAVDDALSQAVYVIEQMKKGSK